MHCSSFEAEGSPMSGGEVLVAVTALVTEGRIPGKISPKSKGFHEGPHCQITRTPSTKHCCDATDPLCLKYERVRGQVLELWQKGIPLCMEVLLMPGCSCVMEDYGGCSSSSSEVTDSGLLLEQWFITVNHRRIQDKTHINLQQLLNAMRSQLHFSQISAWLSSQEQNVEISNKKIFYRLSLPGESPEVSQFTSSAIKHDFPATDIGSGLFLQVSLLSLPRLPNIPKVKCSKCDPQLDIDIDFGKIQIGKSSPTGKMTKMFDGRMHTVCTQKGKHRCEDFDVFDCSLRKECKSAKFQRDKEVDPVCQPSTSGCGDKSKLCVDLKKALKQESGGEKRNLSPNELQKAKNFKLDLFRDEDDCCSGAEEFAKWKASKVGKGCSSRGVWEPNLSLKDAFGRYLIGRSGGDVTKSESDSLCDTRASGDINCSFKDTIYVDKHCDSPIPRIKSNAISDHYEQKSRAKQKIDFGEEQNHLEDLQFQNIAEIVDDNGGIDIPTPLDQAKFRKSLDNATSMVFHSRTGLPLTSSPAPVRRGKSCFDFDSSITSVSAIGNALFSLASDEESESDCSIVSPSSPDSHSPPIREPHSVRNSRRRRPNSLLGTFEESVLNGRLDPVSTVEGFSAELGASGSFVPRHSNFPVTVFFYNLGDNEKLSSPYLAHINLGRKGYQVPRSGTVQVTLFNPLGTVVKMFVIAYDLSDMPPNCQTFIRQRTLYMPVKCRSGFSAGMKWLRYLIHLRFMSSKSGRIYLHSDVRMIIFRKSDVDTAAALGLDASYELRSFTHMPTNPRFCPRK